MSLSECRIIDLPKISDSRGSLTFIEEECHLPFRIRRVYYLYDVPDDAKRGGHAHKTLCQLIIAISGSFNILLDDGRKKKVIFLGQSNQGLYVGPLIWREMYSFSSGTVCLVLASELYNADDYYREYIDFIQAVASLKP